MTGSSKILVIGATGNTGSGLTPALRGVVAQVRALVRDASKAPALREMGVDVFMGDLNRPATIGPAMEDVDKVYLCTTNGPEQEQQALNAIDAAKKAGVAHIVRHSAWGSAESRIIQQCDRIEEAVKSSGIPWTILKPTFYMQNLMMAAQSIDSDGAFYWDLGDGELAMIDVRDIVDSAFAVLTGSGHEGKSYILTGPEPISLHDVARTFTTVLGKNVTYVNVPPEAALNFMLSLGFPEWTARGYGELMHGFSQGFANRASDSVATLTGRPARSIDQFAHDYAQVFGSVTATPERAAMAVTA